MKRNCRKWPNKSQTWRKKRRYSFRSGNGRSLLPAGNGSMGMQDMHYAGNSWELSCKGEYFALPKTNLKQRLKTYIQCPDSDPAFHDARLCQDIWFFCNSMENHVRYPAGCLFLKKNALRENPQSIFKGGSSDRCSFV